MVVGGKVGVGITNPATAIHVSSGAIISDGTTPGLGIGRGVASGYHIDSLGTGDMRFLSNGAGTPKVFEVGRTGVDLYIAVSGGASQYSPQSVAGDTVFRTGSKAIIFDTAGGGGSQMYLKNDLGGVGISTNAPTSTLHVAGSAAFGSEATQSTFTAAGLLQLVSKSTITTGNGTLSFSTAASAGLTTQTPIFITADGRVGIGGNRFNVAPSGSPTAPDGNVLMMFGKGTDDGAMEAILFTGQGSGGPAGSGAFTTSEKIIFHNYPGSKSAIFTPSGSSIGLVGSGAAASYVGFFTNNTSANPAERMRVHSDGNVGISTNAPTSTLHVAGSASFGSIGQSSFTAQGFWEPFSRTKAQIDALTPTKVGQIIYASDTTLPGLCISTGTAVAQWRKMEGPAGLGCGTNN